MAKTPRPRGRRNRPLKLATYGTHLIYAEGTKTEPLYVENIKRVIEQNYDYHHHGFALINVKHEHLNTLNLVRFATNDVRERLRNGERIDHVWIFFDRDDFQKDDFDNAHAKIIKKNTSLNKEGERVDKNGIMWHSVWSNECFEVWVLLHFEFLSARLPRQRYIPKINRYLQSETYIKNRTDLYDLLVTKGDVNNAIAFAKKLYEQNGIENPSTGVYQFVDFFALYLGIKNASAAEKENGD